MSSLIRGHRVLLVGALEVGSMGWFVGRALETAGAEVVRLDSRQIARLWVRGQIGSGIERISHAAFVKTAAFRRRLSDASSGADLMITIRGDHLDPDVVASLARRIPVVNWHPDHPFFDCTEEQIAPYSLFCPKDDWSTSRLRMLGFGNVATLRHASDVGVYAGEPRGAGYAVLGTLYPYRLRWLRRAVSKGVPVQVWGGKRLRGPESVEYHRRPVVGTAAAKALHSSFAYLNTHNPLDVTGGNQMLFDAAAAGLPQVTERFADSQAAFDDGSEVLMFEGVDDFDALTERVLRRDPTLAEVGRAARARVVREHTYNHRLDTLMTLL